jgi:hypothetical protein
MQLFQTPFDANTVKPNEAFEPLPAGWYNARIINSEAKPTKDNLSGYLQLDLEVLDGEHKGRKVFDRLNLWNEGPNKEKTCEIAQRQLSAYCHATGVFILQDSNQLHGIPLKIKLAIRQSEGFDPTNDVKAVKHIQDGTGTAQPTAAAPTFPSAPQPATSVPFASVPGGQVPFGQNPSLPAQPVQVPASSPPWSMPAAAAPAFTPQAPVGQGMPTGGPVPPWRK